MTSVNAFTMISFDSFSNSQNSGDFVDYKVNSCDAAQLTIFFKIYVNRRYSYLLKVVDMF